MNGQLVPINLTPAAKLPLIFILPVRISNGLGIQRRYVIADRQQEVPTTVRDWLAADRRYAPLLNPISTVYSAETVVEKMSEIPQDKTDETPGELKKLWNPRAPSPILRAYAAANDVELPESNQQQGLVDALRAALPELEAP